MIKSVKEKKTRDIEIDLTGPEGNAFYLIGCAIKFAKQIGLDSNKVQSEMMTGDYENLISVFDKYFGKFVTLYR